MYCACFPANRRDVCPLITIERRCYFAGHAVGDRLARIIREMRVSLRRLRSSVAEKLSGQVQRVTAADGPARKIVPEVVQSNIIELGLMSNRVPGAPNFA